MNAKLQIIPDNYNTLLKSLLISTLMEGRLPRRLPKRAVYGETASQPSTREFSPKS